MTKEDEFYAEKAEFEKHDKNVLAMVLRIQEENLSHFHVDDLDWVRIGREFMHSLLKLQFEHYARLEKIVKKHNEERGK